MINNQVNGPTLHALTDLYCDLVKNVWAWKRSGLCAPLKFDIKLSCAMHLRRRHSYQLPLVYC